MNEYKYRNGIGESGRRIALSVDRFKQFIETTDGEIFQYSNVINNSNNPCYKIIIRKQDGKKFNANMNNGIAYVIDESVYK